MTSGIATPIMQRYLLASKYIDFDAPDGEPLPRRLPLALAQPLGRAGHAADPGRRVSRPGC